MNQEESQERTEQDRRYRGSQDDNRVMRSQFDRLIGEVGEMRGSLDKMTVAITGDNIGNEGIVPQMKAFKARLDFFEERLDLAEMTAKQAAADAEVKAAKIKADADKKQFYLAVIWTLIGVVATGIFMSIMNHFFK